MDDEGLYQPEEPIPWHKVPNEKLVDEELIEGLKLIVYSERLRYGNELAVRFKHSHDPKIVEQLERLYKEELIAEVLDFPPEIMIRKNIWDNLFLDARREVFKQLIEEDSPLVMRKDLLKVADAQMMWRVFQRHSDEFELDQLIENVQRSLELAHYIINAKEHFQIGTIEKIFSAASEEDKFLALQQYYDEFTPQKRLQRVLECGQSSVTPALFDFLIDQKFFDELTDSQLQSVTVHFIQTSAKDKMLNFLRSKFDQARFVDFIKKCLDNTAVADELRASIIFNAPEDFSVELIMKLWSKAEQPDRAKIFERRGKELIDSQLQFLLEAMAKGELPLSAIDALEKRFGATELAKMLINSVDKKFFSSKMTDYILGLRKELPIELIVDLIAHTPLKGKYIMLARYAKTLPRDRLILLANELVRDDNISVVGEILRSTFDEKEFIELVTECAAWSIEHDADIEMHFTMTTMKRRILLPRKWANFIFNAPERFPIDIIVKLSPYAWMHDQMTAMEKYFYDFPIEQRFALGYALIETPLDKEELPDPSTAQTDEIMQVTYRFEQRQERLKGMLDDEGAAPEELLELSQEELFQDSSVEFPRNFINEFIDYDSLPEKLSALDRYFDKLDEAQRLEFANDLVETKFAERLMKILRSKMSGDVLANFIWDCKEQSDSVKRAWAALVLKTPGEFPEALIRSLKPFATSAHVDSEPKD